MQLKKSLAFMLYKWFSNMFSKKINNTMNGFTLVEVLTSITLSFVAFWGIMTLYIDIEKNHVQDQILEEIRFNLTTAMDKIVEDIKNADSVSVTTTPFSKKINIIDFDVSTGLISESHYYTAKDNEGIRYDNEKLPLPGYHLFDEDGPYGIIIESFELEKKLNAYDTGKYDLRNNFYDLTVVFKLFSRINENFERLFTFNQQILSLNTFATGTGEDSDE